MNSFDIAQHKHNVRNANLLLSLKEEMVQQNSLIYNGKVKIGSASGLSVAGGEQAPVYDPDIRHGWYFKKDVADTAKFNYYFYGEGNKAVTLGELKSVFANVTIDNYQNISSVPFFIVYTKPTGVNDYDSWYHSKVIYTMDASSTIMLGEEIEIYSINKQTKHHKHRRMVSFNTKLLSGEGLSTEEILTVSIHSDSSAPANTQILVKNVGIEILKDNETVIKRIQLA